MISYNLEHMYHHEEISDRNSHCREAGVLICEANGAMGIGESERSLHGPAWSSRIASAVPFLKANPIQWEDQL